ncbi:hypothetical protein [Devosia sp. XK-2]|uniref:hypothetical protein n=1 Tax=Devosia sp. XK-2 TaxID=3126689 RepID=UPI0030D08DEF
MRKSDNKPTNIKRTGTGTAKANSLIRGFDDERVPADEGVRRRLRQLAEEVRQVELLGDWRTLSNALVESSKPEFRQAAEEQLEQVLSAADEISDAISSIRIALHQIRESAVQSSGFDQKAYFQAPELNEDEELIAEKYTSNLPQFLWRLGSDKTIPIEYRKMLLFLVENGKSFKELIVEHFGCSEKYAEQAEALVVEFMQSNARGARQFPEELTPLELLESPPRYNYTPRMDGGIERYLRDNWQTYIQKGLLTRPDLKRIDRSAYYALNNYLKRGRKLPGDISVPDRSEAIDREIGVVSEEEAKRLQRLASAARRRKGPSGP